jgi:amidase
MESIGSALGPLSKSISGVQAFTQAVIESKPWLIDPKTPEIPWRQDMCDLKHLTEQDGTTARRPVFGLMTWDENVMPWPPVRRAMQTAVDALKGQGYESGYTLVLYDRQR